MQHHELFPQSVITLNVQRINDNRVIDRAHLLAGGGVVVADALSAAIGIDLVELVPH